MRNRNNTGDCFINYREIIMFILFLITQIGLKTDNFVVCNLAYPGTFLFSALDGGDYSGKGPPNNSWIVSEPLGGFVGGFLGVIAGAIMGGGGLFCFFRRRLCRYLGSDVWHNSWLYYRNRTWYLENRSMDRKRKWKLALGSFR